MKKYIKNQIQILKDDIKYLNKNFKDLDSFNVELKKTIKKYTLKINESKDLNEKKEYTDKLGRYYNLLYYINFLKNEDKMYLLDDELTSLPPVYIVDQKPELFTVDQELLDNINIQEGLEEEQALELLKWTSNNTRSNISKSKKMDLYDNCDLCGYCGFSQFSSLYPLKKMGFKISVNNIGSISNYRHAFGTVTIPIKKNGSIINKQYLIDCTYNQFLRVNDNVAFRYIKETAGIGFFINQDIKNIEFSKKLLKDGFIEIDENNIEYYIKPFCLRNVELKKLDKFNKSFSKIDLLKHLENVQEQFDYEEEEFINWDFNLNINDNEKKL